MKNRLSYSTRRFVFIVGAFCAYGLLAGGLIILNANNPHAKGEATFDTVTMDFPSSNAAPAARAAIAALPIQELHRKTTNLPVEVFADPN